VVNKWDTKRCFKEMLRNFIVSIIWFALGTFLLVNLEPLSIALGAFLYFAAGVNFGFAVLWHIEYSIEKVREKRPG
jgi:hypothetical protein